MKDWIEKNLDPPGMARKNLRSIFSFIGRVFGIVKNDAIKAHNAVFPYLCDHEKLREHGQALMIPEVPGDTEDEYRERVASASFYLMRAGERAYIHDQMKAHFGEKYLLTEEFLKVCIKILDLSDEDRVWVYGFLDGILDPNISFVITEWYQFFNEVYAGVIPVVNGFINVLAKEDDANEYLAVMPEINCQINILSEES